MRLIRAPSAEEINEDNEIEALAILIGIDIERKAREIIAISSPVGKSKRIVSKPIDFETLILHSRRITQPKT